MPYPKDLPKNECLDEALFGKKVEMLYKMSIRDIFLEQGLQKLGEDDKNYYVRLVSMGTSFSSPTHLQYSNFFINKTFANSIFEKISLKSDDKKIYILLIFLFST